MQRSSSPRLFFALFYLGAVFALGGLVYQRLAAFSGELPLALGRTEKSVVRPSRAGQVFVGMQRRAPLDVIAFDNPAIARRLLDPDLAYDAMTLPFRLRLEEADVLREYPPRDVLRVRAAEDRREIPLHDGATITFDDQAYRVTLRRWSGLVRHPKGQPMAAFSLRRRGEPWTEHLFVDAENWLRVAPGIGLRLRWHTDEEAARAAHAASPESLFEGRWGVVDNGAVGRPATTIVHWSTSFVPGTGHVLRDGTEATLVEFKSEPPRITVEFAADGKQQRETLDANARDPESRLRFEWPAAWQHVVAADAWREGHALVAAYELPKAQPAAAKRFTGEIKDREAWRPDEFPYEIRLDQLMGAALPVPETEQPVFEALLESAGETLALRQGENMRHGDVMLAYRREPTPPEVRCTLRAVPIDGGDEKTFTIGPGERRRQGDWIFAIRPDLAAADAVVLRAERTLGSPAKLLGMALFIVGAFGLVFARFGRRGGEPPADTSFLDEDSRGDRSDAS